VSGPVVIILALFAFMLIVWALAGDE